MHAVIIDDDPVTRTMIQAQLESAGISSDAAGDAERGMELIRQTRPGLCIVDWIMPGIQGTTVVRAIRDDPALRDTYVIMITAMARVEELAVAFHAGVDDYIRKPIHHAELSARLRAAVRLTRSREALDAKMREISELNDNLQAANARLNHLATTDMLTGVPNRLSAFEELSQSWAEWHRYQTPFSLALIDADHFKSINDTFGHGCGDLALKHIATLIADEKRTMDTFGRYGGEEFVLGLPHLKPDEAYTAVDRLRKIISERPLRIGDQSIPLSVCVGLAVAKADTSSLDQLIANADQALYAAKRNGRNRVYAFDESDPACSAAQTWAA